MRLREMALSAAAVFFLCGAAAAADIEFVIGGKTYQAELLDNDAAKDLAAKMPLTLPFEDYASTERIAYLPSKLRTGNAPQSSKPEKGSVSYFAPWGNLAVFLHPFRESDGLVPLGKISAEGLAALEKSGDHPVTIRLKVR